MSKQTTTTHTGTQPAAARDSEFFPSGDNRIVPAQTHVIEYLL